MLSAGAIACLLSTRVLEPTAGVAAAAEEANEVLPVRLCKNLNLGLAPESVDATGAGDGASAGAASG